MRLTTRIARLTRGAGCLLCGTGAVQFTIRTDGSKRGPGEPAAEYRPCPACGRRVLVWFTIAIDRVEARDDAGGDACD